MWVTLPISADSSDTCNHTRRAYNRSSVNGFRGFLYSKYSSQFSISIDSVNTTIPRVQQIDEVERKRFGEFCDFMTRQVYLHLMYHP